MTKEERFAVNPLERYFLDSDRSGARWTIKHRPRFGSSATNWDLQVERRNQVLLIEAKYIRGAFARDFGGLVTAPLTNRTEKMKSGKKKSWSSVICWAIGCGYKKSEKDKMKGIYQILLDYLTRNLAFYRCYSDTLKVKYIFFVNRKKVAKIRFNKVIALATQYKSSHDEPLSKRRQLAENLLKDLKFK